MNAYSFALQASRHLSTGVLHIRLASGTCIALTLEEARELVTIEAKRQFPEELGYESHTITVNIIDQNLLLTHPGTQEEYWIRLISA